MVPLSDAVKEQIRTQFAAERDRKRAEELLLQYGSSLSQREVERMRRDLLELCGSSLEELWHYIGRAKLDYRDIIFWAEYEEDERGNPVVKAKFRNTPPHSKS